MTNQKKHVNSNMKKTCQNCWISNLIAYLFGFSPPLLMSDSNLLFHFIIEIGTEAKAAKHACVFTFLLFFYCFFPLIKFNLSFRPFWLHIANDDVMPCTILDEASCAHVIWKINIITWFVFRPKNKKHDLTFHLGLSLIYCNNVIYHII